MDGGDDLNLREFEREMVVTVDVDAPISAPQARSPARVDSM